MRLYNKSQLKLKEQVFKKKDVTLKEFTVQDNQGYNDINGIANSLTNNGQANVVANPDKNVINATVLSKDNEVTPQEVTSQIGDTIKTAQKTNSEVNVTGIKLPSNAKKIGQSNSSLGNGNLSAISEGFSLSKSEMNKFLKKKF